MHILSKHRYLFLSLLAAFFIGCLLALCLRELDRMDSKVTPITGKLLDLSSFGFTMTIPDDYSTSDLTEPGGEALLSMGVGTDKEQLFIYCYENESDDHIDDYDPLDIYRYYQSAGCDEVKMQTLGGTSFISYRASVETETGREYWYEYETWNPELHLVFETKMASHRVLPILVTLTFLDPT